MIRSLTPEQNELYQRVGEVLHYLWDPVGVSGVPEARDEYDLYVPRVFALLRRRVSTQEIADFLHEIETKNMGLGSSDATRNKAREIADILETYREWISEKHAKV